MLNFWDWLVDIFSNIGLIIEQAIVSTLNAIYVIQSIILLPSLLSGFIPAILHTSLIVFLAVAVLKFLLGR